MDRTNQTESPIRVVGICGSLREISYTRMALEVALRGAEELNAEIHLLHLKDYQMAFCDGGDTYPPDVTRLRQEVQQAKGIILGTPVYHASFSGVLKNALDLMGFEEFGGKIVGLVGVAGGRSGAISALDGLRTIARSLHAWAIPEEVSIPEVWRVFEKSGQIKDDSLEERLLQLGRQVTRFAYLHLSAQAQEFLQLWESSAENPGGEN